MKALEEGVKFANENALTMNLRYEEVEGLWYCSFSSPAYKFENGQKFMEYFEAKKCSTPEDAIRKAIKNGKDWYK